MMQLHVHEALGSKTRGGRQGHESMTGTRCRQDRGMDDEQQLTTARPQLQHSAAGQLSSPSSSAGSIALAHPASQPNIN